MRSKIKNESMNISIKPSLGMQRRLLPMGLVLVCVLLAMLLAAFIAVSAVVLESHTYKRAAKDEAYLSGVENAVIDIMKDAARENGLSKTMLMKHAQPEDIHKLAKQNAADTALVLKGSQVIYGDSFNEAALQTDIYKFYERRLPEPEAEPEESVSPEPTEISDDSAQQPTQDAGEPVEQIQAQDTAPLLGKTEEDPEREALRERADKIAAKISAAVDAAVRVIDMEQVVYNYSDGYVIDWLRFMGRGGILLPLVLLGIMLLLLYRQTWERGFSPWLAGLSISSGILMLGCAASIPAMGWMDLSIEPVQLAILYATMVKGILAELIVMAALWFIIGYISIRAAIGKPVSTKWLRALFARFKKPPAESADGDPDLLQTMKKAAADSTNSLLGRKRR